MNQGRKVNRGIYLLPNLFTTAGMFSGFYAIIAAMNGRFEAAAVAIFIAMVMDGLDGRIARMTNTQSEFGMQYDSLADLVAFGLAPALVVYVWALSSLGKVGWLGAFVYAAGTALRLARFNTQVETIGKRYFQGLASPPAAALVASMVWFAHENNIEGERLAWVALVITISAGVLMVSNIRYRSFKDIDLKDKVPFVGILLMVLLFIFISINPPYVLFAMAFTYAASGPLLTLFFLRKRRAERDAVVQDDSVEQSETAEAGKDEGSKKDNDV